jgi:hypothetical protein
MPRFLAALLAEVARGPRCGIPDAAFQLVVAASIVSITVNPVLFRLVGPAGAWFRARPGLLGALEGRAAPAGTETEAA